VDAGVQEGDAITPFYDPMIAKLIAWGQDRDEALARLSGALSQFEVAGVSTNIAFLRRLVASRSFQDAVLDTGLIERERTWLSAPEPQVEEEGCLLAALAVLADEAKAGSGALGGRSPWEIRDGWRANATLARLLHFHAHGRTDEVQIEYSSQRRFRIRCKGREVDGAMEVLPGGLLRAAFGEKTMRFAYARTTTRWTVFWNGHTWQGDLQDPLARKAAEKEMQSNLLSPMPGRITSVLVGAGEPVTSGTPLLVLEAMKMEYTVRAPVDGRVERFLFGVGDQVPASAQLLLFEPAAKAKGT
jgi:3-methylcrotonyl-CoA carboxylase alpha subunit